MAIILNGAEQRPYLNGEVGEVWCNGIKRYPSGLYGFCFEIRVAEGAEWTFTLLNNYSGTVYWGDGTSDRYENGNTYTVSHVYRETGNYVVSMRGTCDQVSFFQKTSLRRVLTPFLPQTHPGHAYNHDYIFTDCYNLTEICDHLFDHWDRFIGSEQMFYNCKELTAIPPGLFDCFDDVEDPSRLVLLSWFARCEKIASAVPEIWNRFPESLHDGCFYRCTRAANYADIPADWK